MRWIHLWRTVAVLAAIDTVALGAWTVLGWGLRGSGYEEGRPTTEDIVSQQVIWALLATMVAAHLGVAVWGVAKGRRDAWVGSLVAAAMFPITLAFGVLLVGGALRIWFG